MRHGGSLQVFPPLLVLGGFSSRVKRSLILLILSIICFITQVSISVAHGNLFWSNVNARIKHSNNFNIVTDIRDVSGVSEDVLRILQGFSSSVQGGLLDGDGDNLLSFHSCLIPFIWSVYLMQCNAAF